MVSIRGSYLQFSEILKLTVSLQKCKLMGMKTSWVLTEEDKTKLAIRRESSPIAGINVGDGGLAPIHIIKKVNLVIKARNYNRIQ